MIVNGKDGHIPSVEDFKSLTKDMPEINLGIAEDKYAARLMVAQLENGGQIHNVPKLSKLKDAEPEMIEKLARMKEKSAEKKQRNLRLTGFASCAACLWQKSGHNERRRLQKIQRIAGISEIKRS